MPVFVHWKMFVRGEPWRPLRKRSITEVRVPTPVGQQVNAAVRFSARTKRSFPFPRSYPPASTTSPLSRPTPVIALMRAWLRRATLLQRQTVRAAAERNPLSSSLYERNTPIEMLVSRTRRRPIIIERQLRCPTNLDRHHR